MASNDAFTYRTLVKAFTHFLTVAIHTILHERNIYPKTSFITTRHYNIAIQQNRHPKVCGWINDAVTAVEAQLLKCAVDQVVVAIYNKSNIALERFVFDVSPLPIISEDEIDLPIGNDDHEDDEHEESEGAEGDDGGEDEAGMPMPMTSLVDMDEQFRAVMSRLINCAATLKPIPQGCSYTVAIELKDDDDHAPLSHPQAWMPVAPRASTSAADTERAPKATPIRAMVAGEMAFDVWVEESQAKASSSTSATTSANTSGT